MFLCVSEVFFRFHRSKKTDIRDDRGMTLFPYGSGVLQMFHEPGDCDGMESQVVCQLAVGKITVKNVVISTGNSQLCKGMAEAAQTVAVLKGIAVTESAVIMRDGKLKQPAVQLGTAVDIIAERGKRNLVQGTV